MMNEVRISRRGVFRMSGVGAAAAGLLAVAACSSGNDVAGGASPDGATPGRPTTGPANLPGPDRSLPAGDTSRGADNFFISDRLYAQKLAEQGFVTLSVDHPYWGSSDGRPRNLVAPDNYAESYSAAVDYLRTLDYVHRERIAALGICGSGSFVIGAAKIDPRIKAVGTVSMYDMGAANRFGLRRAVTLEQRRQVLTQVAAQRDAEFTGAAPEYTSGTVHELTTVSTPVEREFYDFYRTSRGGCTPAGVTPQTTTHPTLTSNARCLNYFPMEEIETISPRPMMIVTGEHAHSCEFAEDAYRRAAEPKELVVVPAPDTSTSTTAST